MENSLAPILLFTYNRPEHTTRLLNSLKKCDLSEDSELFVFIDAPKLNATEKDIQQNKAVTELVKEINHFKKITIYQNDVNKGVDKSIMDGVTKIVNLYGKVIVLEDDLIVGRFFLKYFNWALSSYEFDKRVYSVNGFMFPVTYSGDKDTVLLRYSSAWGWGTWKDRWELFKYDEENRYSIIDSKELTQSFNLPGIDYANMLITNKECWDINWYFHVFKNNGLNVFPTRSLVKNTGFDGSGVHCPDIAFNQNFDIDTKLELVKETGLDLVFLKSYFQYFNAILDAGRNKIKLYLRKRMNKYLR